MSIDKLIEALAFKADSKESRGMVAWIPAPGTGPFMNVEGRSLLEQEAMFKHLAEVARKHELAVHKGFACDCPDYED